MGSAPAMLFVNLKAYASRHVLATLAVCTLIPGTALAQSETPVFTPAGGWTVGSTELSNVRGLQSMKLPCVLSTEYDNGFVVRFSGGGGQLLAMAVDFRQNVFQKGRKYTAMVSLGDTYVKQVNASAFTGSTLIFNLRPLKDFYGAVKQGNALEIDIDGNNMKFNLGQLSSAYKELEGCYAGGKAEPLKPMPGDMRSASIDSQMPPVAVPSVEAKPLPQSFDEIVQNADADSTGPTPMPQQNQQMKVSQVTPRTPDNIAPRANTVSRATTPAPAAPMPLAPIEPRTVAAATWNAKAGEDIKIVLSRWAERAGYDLEWQSSQGGKVAQDMKLSGSFEDAVGQLMAENSAATGIDAHVETAQGAKKDIAKASIPEPRPQAPAVKASIPALHDNWSAPAGANIQTILDQWASKAGVAIVWQSYMSVAVKKPVSVSGSFEEAVQTLLDQYSSDSSRPLGQLNIDPETGARTLLMEMGSAG